jgi:hypothetical protein
MKRKSLLVLLLIVLKTTLYAGEGMWIPSLLKEMKLDDMQASGLRLSAEQLYSINTSSVKDAIVHFGGGCTAELISSDGLLLTNHHCGYGAIQSHSSVESDYLTDGYWAKNSKEELTNPGLTATIIKRIEDVTAEVLDGVTAAMNSEEREKKMAENSKAAIEKAVGDSNYEALIKPFYYGNEFYLFVTETFKDVRLVGAPPSSIGKYGFDTDNWIWPRHTGDFSLFRIYANKDNQPEEYNENNVAYQPNYFLPISLEGIKEGDFTMVYGFPGITQEYLSSHAVELIQNVSDPLKVQIRTKKLEVLDAAMATSDAVRIQYASKQSGTSNSWKKWKGEIRGLKKLDAIKKKQETEAIFAELVAATDSFADYKELLPSFERNYNQLRDVQVARDYFVEIAYFGIESMRYIAGYRSLVKDALEGKIDSAAALQKQQQIKGYFKDYDLATDQRIFVALMALYNTSPQDSYRPRIIKEVIEGKYKGDIAAYADYVYKKSVFTSSTTMDKLLQDWSKKSAKKMANDPFFELVSSLYENYTLNIKPLYNSLNDQIEELNKEYMRALQEVLTEKQYYPDANSTLRIAYGKVNGYHPRDGVYYDYYTTLDGAMEKYNPEVKEFDLPAKLIELHARKDYGRYGKDGVLNVCFIASNHTTGGNSGSPVLNEEGELIGLNFDRNWEGTMSDLMYDPDQCRNISVDIRYVLFIIDKFAGAGYLLEKMKLIEAKGGE